MSLNRLFWAVILILSGVLVLSAVTQSRESEISTPVPISTPIATETPTPAPSPATTAPPAPRSSTPDVPPPTHTPTATSLPATAMATATKTATATATALPTPTVESELAQMSRLAGFQLRFTHDAKGYPCVRKDKHGYTVYNGTCVEHVMEFVREVVTRPDLIATDIGIYAGDTCLQWLERSFGRHIVLTAPNLGITYAFTHEERVAEVYERWERLWNEAGVHVYVTGAGHCFE